MMKQSFDAAAETMKKVAGAPGPGRRRRCRQPGAESGRRGAREEGGEAPGFGQAPPRISRFDLMAIGRP